MSEDFNLNDVNKLNPDINPVRSTTPRAFDLWKGKKLAEQVTPKYTKEEKKEVIEKWNNKKETKDNGIVAIDKSKKRILTTLSVFGTAFLIVLIIVGGIIGLTIYKDGTLKSTTSILCGQTNITVQPTNCPTLPLITIPKCPDVSCPQSNFTCAPQITVYTNST